MPKVRTDSVLSTGMSSARDEAIRAKNKARIEQKKQKAAVLKDADVLLGILDEVETEVCDLRDLLKRPKHLNSDVELAGRAHGLEVITKIRRRLRIAMNIPAEAIEKDGVVDAWVDEAKEGGENVKS